MGNFRGNDRRGGRGTFDRPRRDFNQDRGGKPQDRQMHQAVCDSCGKKCEVPFRPTGARPIFCSECFEKNGGGAQRSGGDRGARRPSFGDRKSYPPRNSEPNPNSVKLDEINAKLDKILRHLFPAAPIVAPDEVSHESQVEEPRAIEDVIPVKKKTSAKKSSTKEVSEEAPSE